MLWVVLWGFSAGLLSEGSFFLRLWTVKISPGALPAPFPNAHTPYPHPIIIWFPCCKTGWLATRREGAPSLALGHPGSWPCLQEGVPQEESAPSFQWSPLLLLSSLRATTAWLCKAVQNSLMWGWGGGQWGIDGWLCFLICAIVLDNIKAACKRRN
jgi:hypothetical protein